MNKYVKEFFHRGLMFGGFGPIVTAIVLLILSHTIKDFSISGNQVFMAVVSTYIVAFVHAGSSIFHQIEHWSTMKGLFCQLGSLYLVYVLTYIINSWIPFEPLMLLIFFFSFLIIYLIIWLTVYFSVKAHTKRLNLQLVKAQKE